MTTSRFLRTAATAVVCGLASLTLPAVAHADDINAVPPALLDTQCSLDQLMAATQLVNPVAYDGIVTKYNAEPPWIQGGVINHLNLLLQKSPADRQAEIDTLGNDFPEYAALFRTQESSANGVAAKCSTFPTENSAVWSPLPANQ